MAKRKKLVVTYYNTNNLPQGEELEQRKRQCNTDAERVLFLYELYRNMTLWEAYRKYIEFYGGVMQKVAVGARINGLCKLGILYKSTEQIREERGALNNFFKLWPEDNEFPEDFDMTTLDKINVPLCFGPDGQPDAERTRQDFETKLQIKLNEYTNG